LFTPTDMTRKDTNMDPITLLRQLTRFAPAYRPAWPENSDMICGYCLAVFEPDKETNETYESDECLHDEECPWRLAVEYLQKLG
jgi:hypothetical protein